MNKILALKKNEEAALKALKEAISERFNLIDLRVFGSKVRGEDSPDSDVDVMIELTESDPEVESEIYDLIFEINLKNDSFISAVIFTQKEIDNGPMAESPLYKVVRKEGIPI